MSRILHQVKTGEPLSSGWKTGSQTQMNYKVVLNRTKRKPGDRACLPSRQAYRFPPHLFEDPGFSEAARHWTCVRTRPRWEKKLALWLQHRQQQFFLPVFCRETSSGRKRRVSELPLFTGFLFLAGIHTKADLAETGCVAYVLRPRGEAETVQLHRELCGIWCGLTSGLYVTPFQNLAGGEACRIIAGPLRGLEAKFERMGRKGRLILQVEMMGGGIAVELPVGEVEPCG